MGLNIVATRKFYLNEFGEGWEDCYLIVKSVSDTHRKKWSADMEKKGKAAKDQDKDEIAIESVRMQSLEVVMGGVVLNTNEDGTTELVEVTKADVPDVIDALGFTFQMDIVAFSTGAYRLKEKI